MARINPKLNLNKTPQNAEDYSLVFAKNIKVTSDGSISRENNIYKLLQDHDFPHTKILTCVPHNNKLYIVYVQNMSDRYIGSKMRIAMYDESIEYTIYQAQKVKSISANFIDTALTYHGGLVDGLMSVNLRGQRLLTINEYFESEDNENYVNIPLRTVNLEECSEEDDESFYTQSTNVPICNLNMISTYNHTIPNGAYQFFIRWETHKNQYTQWLPCSKICFTGNHNTLATQAGSLRYTDELSDSPTSFIFALEQVNDVDKSKFLSYQLGFILSHDDDVIARKWKHFNTDVTKVYFTYEENDIEETDVDTLLFPVYDIFNVKNVVNFKTNLYISNYKETDFNPDLFNFVINNTPKIENLKCNIFSNNAGDTENLSFTYKSNSDKLIEYINWNDGNSQRTDRTYEYIRNLFLNKNFKYAINLNSIETNEFRKYYNIRYEGNQFIQEKGTKQEYDNCYGDNISYSPGVDSGTTSHAGASSSASRHITIPQGLIESNLAETSFVGISDCHTLGQDLDDSLDYILEWDTRLSKQYGIDEKAVVRALLNNIIDEYNNLTPSDRSDKIPLYIHNTISKYYDDNGNTEIDTNKVTWLSKIANGQTGYTKHMLANNESGSTYRLLLRNPLRCIEDNDVNPYFTTAKTVLDGEHNYIIEANNQGQYVYFTPEKKGLSNASIDFIFNGAYSVTIKAWIAHDAELVQRYNIGHGDSRVVVIYQVIRHNYTYNFDNLRLPIGNPYSSLDNTQTLIPYHHYNFFIHYVKDSGEITNGYKLIIDETQDDPYDFSINANDLKDNGYDKQPDIDYAMQVLPIFTKVAVPDGYCAYFISFRHTKNDTIHIINNKQTIKALYDSNDKRYSGNAYELDLRLHSQIAKYDAIDIDENEYSCIYNHSSDKNIPYFFGNSGKAIVPITESEAADLATDAQADDFISGEDLFAIIKTEYDNLNNTLTKCTPYISGKSFDESNFYGNLQLDGYICLVTKLLSAYNQHPHHFKEETTKYATNSPQAIDCRGEDNYYSDGDTYYKKVDTNAGVGSTAIGIITIEGLTYTVDDKEQLRELLYTNYYSYEDLIYSKYNLNFLQLRETISPKIVRANTDKSYTVYNLNSLIFADLYKFPSMYKNFVRPQFSIADLTNNYTIFENTVRKSTQIGDEDKQYNYYFNPVDYYNIPTNKGIIVKLISTGEAILVHTKDSIFKFSGNNTITANGGEDVQLQENNVFDTGVSELFGSEHGFGGLQNKYHSAISQAGYLFYDASCYKVYFFNGQSNIKTISDSIQKIMDTYKFDDVAIANDYFNNRMILCFSKTKLVNEEEVSTFLTISYSLITQDWCSLHDYRFNKAYCTKNRCYVSLALDAENKPNSKVSAFYNIYEIYEQDGFDIPLELKFVDTIFPHYPYWTNFATAKLYCIVDIIVKGNYEQLKSLDSISWICNKVLSYSNYDNVNGLVPYDVNASLEIVPIGFAVAEENMYADITNQTDTEKDDGVYVTNPYDRYKGDAIWIYSDSCFSDLINVLDKSNNKLNNPNSHKYPRYNSGIWSLNYFRNAKGLNVNGNYVSDDSSLIYGKYFVIRFIFNPNNNFKLENLIANFNNYIG